LWEDKDILSFSKPCFRRNVLLSGVLRGFAH
jgi:hypothetical protein